MHEADELFSADEIVDFLDDPAPVVGFSCMANLLPFTLLAMREPSRSATPTARWSWAAWGPSRSSSRSCERFPWVDLIVRGEAERSAPSCSRALRDGGDLAEVPGISCRDGEGRIVHNERPERIADLDGIAAPAYHHIDLPALHRLRHDHLPRLPLPVHLLLGGAGLGPASPTTASTRRSSTR